jgi:uroporphyrinogen decarboxylase
VNLASARKQIAEGSDGKAKALQGNIDPNVLFAPPAQIEAEVAKVLQAFGKPHADRNTKGPTHIFNLGHGISQFTPPDHVAALVQAVHAQSRALRS